MISLEPKWAEAIFSGDKEYEYRRVVPNVNPPFYLLLFATGEKKSIVGEALVDRILESTPSDIIDETIEETPHSRDYLNNYFANQDVGVAFHIKDYEKYESPIGMESLKEEMPSFHPPQGFTYIKPEVHDSILNRVPSYNKKSKQDDLASF